MKHDNRAFIDMENALAGAVLPAFDTAARPIVAEIAAAHAAGDEALVESREHDLDAAMRTAVRRASGRVELLLVSMLNLGTFNITERKSGIFSAGKNIPEDMLARVHRLHDAILETRATKLAKDYLREVLRADTADQHGVVDLQKADYSNLVGALTDAVLSGTRIVADVGANLTTSRLVNYGALAELTASGILTYRLQAILDERTTEICRNLNGRQFQVALALSHLNTILQITDPEELKAASPFVSERDEIVREMSSLTNEELQDRGFIVPPFHFFCRTIVVKEGVEDTSTVDVTDESGGLLGDAVGALADTAAADAGAADGSDDGDQSEGDGEEN